MPRFEYQVLTLQMKGAFKEPIWVCGEQELGINSDLQGILNTLGADGWEVVSHAKHSGPQDNQIILKRQRQ